MATSDSTMRRPDSTTTLSNCRTRQDRRAQSSSTVAVLVKANSVETALKTISSIRVESKLAVSQSSTVDAVQNSWFSSGLCRKAQQHRKLTPPGPFRPVRNVAKRHRADAGAEATNKQGFGL